MKNLLEKSQFNLPGIYQIRNISNNKVYIGSAFNLHNRFRTHKSRLFSNKHDNEYLQRSFNKYGPESFIFEVIEILENIENIYKIELEYIEKVYGDNCYNINKITDPSKSLIQYNESKKKRFTLISPSNEEFEFFGLNEASRITNCEPSQISKVLNFKIKSCKGWRLPQNKDYDYKNFRSVKNKGAKLHDVKFIGPDGLIYGPIFNMEEFARKHNVNPSIFFNIISGKTRYSNGWSLFIGDNIKPIEKNAKEYNITLISPDGEEFFNIKNLTKFCRERNISVSSIRDLINGNIKKKSYRGWKLK